MVIQAAAVGKVHSAIRQIYPRLFPSRKKRKEAKGKEGKEAFVKGDKLWRKK